MTGDSPLEALGRLEQRLSQASDTAERLLAEAARSRRSGPPPAAGWQTPPDEHDRRRRSPELELLAGGARLFGEMVPPEVLERLAAALRELLLALRALIDYYLERLDRNEPEQAGIQDIPIQ
jgi:hypothetical protein